MVNIGMKGKTVRKVSEEMLAYNVKSGEVSVFATPMLIAAIEETAALSVKPFLGEGNTTVGTQVSVSHCAATPLGMAVYVETELVEFSENGRRLRFRVQAYDDAGLIGEGTHERVIVQKERFEQKAAAKAQNIKKNPSCDG